MYASYWQMNAHSGYRVNKKFKNCTKQSMKKIKFIQTKAATNCIHYCLVKSD